MADDKRNQDKPEYLNQQGTNSGTSGNDRAEIPAADWSTPGNTGSAFTAEGSNAFVYSVPDPSPANSSKSRFDDGVADNSAFEKEAEGSSYQEETAAEFASPVKEDVRDEGSGGISTGSTWGYSALAVSILSLFVLPVALGILGVILGFVARSKGAGGIGTWAIAIGAISLVVGMFVLPFY